MSDIPRSSTEGEMSEHLHSYFTVERLVLFAVLQIALTLSCVALAFIGHIRLLALAGRHARAAFGRRAFPRLVSSRLAW
jgi:hypothetical protein